MDSQKTRRLLVEQVRQWSTAHLVGNPTATTRVLDAYSNFSIWSLKKGLYKISIMRFSMALDDLGYKKLKSNVMLITGTSLVGHASVTTTEGYIRNRRGDRVKPLK